MREELTVCNTDAAVRALCWVSCTLSCRYLNMLLHNLSLHLCHHQDKIVEFYLLTEYFWLMSLTVTYTIKIPNQTIDHFKMSHENAPGLNCIILRNSLNELNSNELNVITLHNIELLNLC